MAPKMIKPVGTSCRSQSFAEVLWLLNWVPSAGQSEVDLELLLDIPEQHPITVVCGRCSKLLLRGFSRVLPKGLLGSV